MAEQRPTPAVERTDTALSRSPAALALGFIENVKADFVPVTAEFLARIGTLPVTPRLEPTTRAKRQKLTVGDSRAWLISTRNLSDRLAEAEAEFDAVGMAAAEPKISDTNYEVRSLRWSGRSRFRREAKAGDLVMEVLTDKGENGKQVEAYFPAPILHRQEADDDRWTRFYIEVPTERLYYEWTDVAAAFASLGSAKISPNSTRQLTGRELGILQLLE